MTTKYDPKKDLQDSVIDAAWLTGGLAIVNLSLKALGATVFWQHNRELWKAVRQVGNGRYVERLYQISEQVSPKLLCTFCIVH